MAKYESEMWLGHNKKTAFAQKLGRSFEQEEKCPVYIPVSYLRQI